MRFFIFYVTSFLAIFSLTTLSAQINLSEGYYVGLKKDTVYGFFDFDGLAMHKVFFYTSKKASTSRKLTPDDVRQIETTDKSIWTFVYSFKEQKQALFISKYVDGNISLYKSTSMNPEESDVFFISTSNMPLIRKINAINPKVFLNTYFKNCELGASFSVKYAENSLLTAMAEISKCAYPNVESTKNTAKKPKFTLNVGFQTAFFMNKSKIKGWLNDQPLRTNFDPLLGTVLKFNFSNSFKFHTGVNYFRRHLKGVDSTQVYTSYSVISGWVYRTDRPLEIVTDFIEIPIALHYEFNKKNPVYIPQLILGASILIPVKTKYETYFNGLGKYTDNSQGLYKSSGINPSFFVGGGIKKVLQNKSSIELNLKYTFETDDPTDKGRFYSDRYILSFNYLFALGKMN